MANTPSLSVPTAEEIQKGFDALAKNTVRDAMGVMEFTGSRPGPTLYVGTCTHGRETKTAGVIVPFLKGQIRVVKGKVIVAINNLLAAHQGIRRLDYDGDHDFNRLPPDLMSANDAIRGKFYSARRLQKLHHAGLFDVTHGVDMHTLAVPAGSMKIHIKGDHRFTDIVAEKHCVDGIVKHQEVDGRPTVAFGNYLGGVGNEHVPVVQIEGGGPHTDTSVVRRLLNGLTGILVYLDMVDPRLVEPREGDQLLYRIRDYQIAPAGYAPIKQFAQFERVREGDVIATDTQQPSRTNILAPRRGHIVMPPTYGESSGDDWWISDPVKKTRQQFLKAVDL